jgi:RNA polymerase primary sigma factor
VSTLFHDRESPRSHLKRYLLEIRGFTPLDRDQERSLGERQRETRDDVSYHGLVQANLGFVIQTARRYAGMGLPLDDLVSEGNVGLLRAARNFDPSRGTKFISYAVWWIRKAIIHALSEQAAGIRVPHTQRRKIRAVLDMERRLAGELGRRAGREEIAGRLQTSTARIDRILQVKAFEVSFEEPVRGGSDITISESLADRSRPDPLNALIRSESRARVRSALEGLGDRERRVLARRFGLEGERAQTLRELGTELGLSPEAIRLIEKRATKKMRRALETGSGRRAARCAPDATRRPPRVPGPRDAARRAPRT